MALTLSIPSDKTGEPKFITVKEETLGLKYEDIVKKVYEGITVVVIHNLDNSKIYIAPFHLGQDPHVPITAIIANDLITMDTGKGMNEVEMTAITQSYWTCGCKKKYVHHKVVSSCEKCGKNLVNCEKRLPYLSDIIKWDLFVE